MKFTVKNWWYEAEQIKAQKYNFTLCWEKATSTIYNGLNFYDCFYKLYDTLSDENYFDFLNKVSTGEILEEEKEIGFCVWGEKIKETEKAIQLNLSYWNLNKAGKYITDAPIETKWTCWIPKSALI